MKQKKGCYSTMRASEARHFCKLLRKRNIKCELLYPVSLFAPIQVAVKFKTDKEFAYAEALVDADESELDNLV